jgi:hypothetical protein
MAENELRFLERRNSALKRELLDVQSEIASLKLKEAETSLKIL